MGVTHSKPGRTLYLFPFFRKNSFDYTMELLFDLRVTHGKNIITIAFAPSGAG